MFASEEYNVPQAPLAAVFAREIIVENADYARIHVRRVKLSAPCTHYHLGKGHDRCTIHTYAALHDDGRPSGGFSCHNREAILTKKDSNERLQMKSAVLRLWVVGFTT